MYHGGSNPKGKLSTLQESRATGYANDLPEINYDFNAPIRQYGTISDNYREIKLLALFLEDFGEDMAVLPAEIFDETIKPEDMHSLRSSARHDDTHGYVFFNNYQRRRVMDAHKNVVFEGPCGKEKVTFPAVDLPSGSYGFFPYHMQLGEAKLLSALATPLCKVKGKKGETFVFYGDFEPKYTWESEITADILHLSREEALNAWKVTLEQDYLVLSENYVWTEDGELKVTGGADTVIRTFPALEKVPAGFEKKGEEGRFTVYERKCQESLPELSVEKTEEEKDSITYHVRLNYAGKKAEDYLLWIEYAGFGLEIRKDGEKINDHFYTGQKVPVSLRYFDFPEELEIKIQALHKEDWVFIEKWPRLKDDRACELIQVSVIEENR